MLPLPLWKGEVVASSGSLRGVVGALSLLSMESSREGNKRSIACLHTGLQASLRLTSQTGRAAPDSREHREHWIHRFKPLLIPAGETLCFLSCVLSTAHKQELSPWFLALRGSGEQPLVFPHPSEVDVLT